MQPEPRATYRLQMRPGFGFDQADEIIEYLSDLGISHVYTSPYLQAAVDSTHGYDVVDPTKINAQLGDEESHERFCESIKTAGMGLMIDIVPNHMAILGKQNPWWWDVLENGPASRYAIYFDVDWDASDQHWPNKVLLPILGDHYGRVLENGDLKLSYENGRVTLHYLENSFPLDPSSLSALLSRAADASHSEMLAFIAESYARLPRPTVTSRRALERRHRDKAVLHNLLERLCQEDLEANLAIENEMEKVNQDPNSLDEIIEQQNYRLAFWRTANRDLGYRRFFDIKELVGLRIEDPEVFRATHALPIKWFLKGWVEGLRIDHPDGLRNPGEYFFRLQEACPAAWIVAEKILEPNEKLPKNWKVAGTTGYDFLNLLNGLFIDPCGVEALAELYKEILDKDIDFKQLVYECKLLVLKELFGSEVNRLSNLFVDICDKHRRHRDYTQPELISVINQTAACFPVYRSYVSVSDNLVSDEDVSYVTMAINLGMEKRPDLDPELFRFLHDLLLLRIPGQLEGEFAMRFQQLTGPVMAKGFEDTALYRYQKLISLNEVGGDPSCFNITLNYFHDCCLVAEKERPLSLLASTTHDTKRSEDVHARLNLLSEIPAEFGSAVKRWMIMNLKHHQGDFPDKNTEYLLYQTLIGAWPINEERILAYMEKAIREAKEHTSWTKINAPYEKAISEFVKAILRDPLFLADFKKFVQPLIQPGRINSLAQTLVKLTAPGIPDTYQGCELWNLSLVDPDSRRMVDFAIRKKFLQELKTLSISQILERMDDGLPKLWVIQQTLHVRKHCADLFNAGSSYKPMAALGSRAEHVIAFMRGESAVTIAPRLIMRLNSQWDDTSLELPSGTWMNVLSGEKFSGDKILLKSALAQFPVALLVEEKKYGKNESMGA